MNDRRDGGLGDRAPSRFKPHPVGRILGVLERAREAKAEYELPLARALVSLAERRLLDYVGEVAIAEEDITELLDCVEMLGAVRMSARMESLESVSEKLAQMASEMPLVPSMKDRRAA